MKYQRIKNIPLFLLSFVFIFSPKFYFFPIDISFIIMAFSFILLLLNKNIQKIFLKYIHLILFLISFSLVWLLIELSLTNSFTSNSYPILCIRIILEILIPSCLLTFLYRKNKTNVYNFIKIMIIIQVIVCILMINMDFKKFIFKSVIEIDEYTAKLNSLRNFGIGRNYLSSFSACCAFLGYILFLDYYHNKKVSSLVIFIINNLILFLNSRTSIIIELFFITSSLFFLRYKVKGSCSVFCKVKKITAKQKYKLLLCLFVGFIIAFCFIHNNKDYFERLGKWIYSGVEEILNLFFMHEIKDGTFKSLNKWYFPSEPSSLLFGYANPKPENMSSDIGYVRFVLYGGLLFQILILFFFLFLYLKVLVNTKNYTEKVFLTLCFLSLLILHYKGDIFTVNEVTRIVILSTIFIDNRRKYGLQYSNSFCN